MPAVLKTITISSASADVANYTELTPASTQARGARQVFLVYAECSGNATVAGAIEFALVQGTTVFRRERAVIDQHSTARRGGLDNASGSYLLTVVFETSGNNKIDAAGEGYTDGQTPVTWKVGMPTLPTNGTAVTLRIVEITEV